MKNKYSFFLFSLLFSFLIFSCNNPEEEEKEPKVFLLESEVNPNGESELAFLMRNLFLDADSFRILIANGEGNINLEFVEMIKKSHEAIPTKASMKPESFDGFNQLLLNDAISLLESETADAEQFNSMVDRCMDCHHEICPGPTRRIQKLYIK